MTYNRKAIMTRAWEIKKENSRNIFAECLKMAWAEAKAPAQKSEKEVLENKLNELAIEANSHENGYHYEACVNDWEKYGKSRTYFAIYETRNGSRHFVKKAYGYFDNIKNEYVPEKYNDLTKNYTVSGAVMQ